MVRDSADGRLYTPDYVALTVMPADTVIPDGIVIVGATLYARREPLGTVIAVDRLRVGGYLIRYRPG